MIRGPSSVLYGSDAIGGTVYVHTIAPSIDEAGANFHSRTGTRYASSEQSIAVRQEFSGNVDGFGWQVGGTYRYFGDIIGGKHYGLMRHTDYNEYGGDLKLLQRLDTNTTLPSACSTSARTGLPAGTGRSTPGPGTAAWPEPSVSTILTRSAISTTSSTAGRPKGPPGCPYGQPVLAADGRGRVARADGGRRPDQRGPQLQRQHAGLLAPGGEEDRPGLLHVRRRDLPRRRQFQREQPQHGDRRPDDPGPRRGCRQRPLHHVRRLSPGRHHGRRPRHHAGDPLHGRPGESRTSRPVPPGRGGRPGPR